MHLRSLIPTLLVLTLPATNAQKLQSITYSGNGCPANTISSYFILSPPKLSHIIAQFMPYVGPGASTPSQRLMCTIIANITAPDPQQRLVLNLDPDVATIKGWVDLWANTTMTVSQRWDWTDGMGNATYNFTFTGPMRGWFRKTVGQFDNPAVTQTTSPCGGGLLRLQLQARAAVTGKLPAGQIEPSEPSDDELQWVTENQLSLAPCT